ncbi:MAG: hypothetical protein Q7S79_03175, partial [bacterium]|nr:hypothetical protein [bacterium]
LGKFLVSQTHRGWFKSVADEFDALQNTTDAQRFAIAHKALLDTHGAFANKENRQHFAGELIGLLGYKPGFIASALESACLKGEARFLGFPAANLLRSRLFRAYDVKSIDIVDVGKYKQTINDGDKEDDEGRFMSFAQYFKPGEMERIFSSSTRDITYFGATYRDSPNSVLARLAAESDAQYTLATKVLRKISGEDAETERVNGAKQILDRATEDIISSIESSSALGPKTLQISTQVRDYPEPVAQRLANSFDSNPGMAKVLGWKYLDDLSKDDPALEAFLPTMRMLQKLGAGSLYTTQLGVLESGEQVVIKMLNLNAEGQVDETFNTVQTILKDVEKKNRGKYRDEARSALSLVEFSRDWCKREINDPTYEEDDDRFRLTVGRYNREADTERFFAPRRVFSSTRKVREKDGKLMPTHVMVEGMAGETTLNKELQKENLPVVAKQEVVRELGKFCDYQLDTPAYQDESGKDVYLAWSDPHVGNLIVAPEGKFGVIDRKMYLKLYKEDVDVLKKLQTGDNLGFLNGLTARVMDVNNVRNPIARKVYSARVLGAVNIELLKQKASGKQDNLGLLRVANSTFEKAKLKVPAELRLMIRNIQAMKELKKRYGVS